MSPIDKLGLIQAILDEDWDTAHKMIVDAIRLNGPTPASELPSLTEEELKILKESGTVVAIRAYRFRTNLSLIECKNAVEFALERQS